VDNARHIAETGETYLRDVAALHEVGREPLLQIQMVPKLTWRSGIAPKAELFCDTTLKNLRDICHFETLAVGFSVGLAKLAVAGLSIRVTDDGSSESDTHSMMDALGVCKEAASIFSFLVNFNQELNCPNITKESFPELQPRILTIMKDYGLLCLGQITFEIAQRKGSLDPMTLCRLAEQNRIYARDLGSRLREIPSHIMSVEKSGSTFGELLNHCQLYEQLMSLIINGHLTEKATKITKYGMAEAYAIRALQAIQIIETKLKPNYVLDAVRNRELSRWRKIVTEAEIDNSKIYFQSVPNVDTHEDRFIVNPAAVAKIEEYKGLITRNFSVSELELFLNGPAYEG